MPKALEAVAYMMICAGICFIGAHMLSDHLRQGMVNVEKRHNSNSACMGALAGFTHEVHQQQAMHAREGHEKFMVVLNKCNVMASSPNVVTLCVHF